MKQAPDQILYAASATSDSRHREGKTTSDGLSLEMRSQPWNGGHGDGANPEQLFAMAYATCFNSSLSFVANGVDVSGSTVVADVGIGQTPPTGYGLAITLHVTLPNLDQQTAEDLAAAADRVCPYSKAVTGNIPVTLVVNQ